MAKRTAKSKHVLLFLRQYRREIHQAIYDYARAQRWTVEFHLHVPTNWRGEGIIADWVSPAEIAQIRDRRPIPVVTRLHSPGHRIGRVYGDIKAIADMGVNYFAMRGFHHMAGVDMFTWGEADPCLQFYETAKARGYDASHFCYAKSREDYDFAAAVTRTRAFLRGLPKPCAVFLGGMHCANIVYRACEMEKISIPHELSILTNDDDALVCETFQPQLSGIAGEINHIGLAMAKMLDAMMDDPTLQRPPAIVPPEKIITRQSTDVLAVSHLPTARAINFIFENYAKLIGVEEVSRHSGISLNALHKNFRDHVGKVPSDFLREVRMNRAKELLEETDLTLDQIAKQTGYSCAMSFYTAFKRLFHMTPGSYRSQSLPNQRRAEPAER
ncbi:MAG: helix-turn-helix domain-containing protein [Verrucomicrobiota bacterium]